MSLERSRRGSVISLLSLHRRFEWKNHRNKHGAPGVYIYFRIQNQIHVISTVQFPVGVDRTY